MRHGAAAHLKSGLTLMAVVTAGAIQPMSTQGAASIVRTLYLQRHGLFWHILQHAPCYYISHAQFLRVRQSGHSLHSQRLCGRQVLCHAKIGMRGRTCL